MGIRARLVTALLVVLVVAACGGGGPDGSVVASSAASAAPSIPDVLNPETPEELAELVCPAADAANCTRAIVEAAAAGQPAALCVNLDSSWEIIRPRLGEGDGSPCGADGLGTIRGIIVEAQ